MTELGSTSVKLPGATRLVVLVLVLALPVRAVVLWAWAGDLAQDVDGYRRLAVNLREQGTFGWQDASYPGGVRPTAFRPPLYPALLAPWVREQALSSGAAGVLNLVLGLATIALAGSTALRWGLGRWSAVAASLVALDPILLHQSAQVMTETLAACLSVAALYLLTRLAEKPAPGQAVVAGALLGFCVLARPTFLPWMALCAGVVLMSGAFRRQRAAVATVLVAAALAVLFPWGARNWYHFGRFTVTTTHGGYTFLLANNRLFYRYLAEAPWGAVWWSDELDQAWQHRHAAPDPQDPRWDDLSRLRAETAPAPPATGRREFEDDRLAYALGMRFACQQPGMFLYSCVVRIGRLWGLMPHAHRDPESWGLRVARWGIAFWYAAVFLLALLGLVRLGGAAFGPPWLFGLLLCLAFTLVHAFYWTDLRMRAPLMPFVAIVAAAGAARLGRR